MIKPFLGRVLRMSGDRKPLGDYVIRPYWAEDLVCVGNRIKVLVQKGTGHIYGAIGLVEKGHPVI